MFGRLIRGMNTARFASTLGILASSGVPLIRALRPGAQTLGNEAMRADVAGRDRAGARRRAAVARAGGGRTVPADDDPHDRQRRGDRQPVARCSQRTATTLSGETERRALALTSLLEPLLILLMGAVVLMIVLAVLLPIIEINQLVR